MQRSFSIQIVNGERARALGAALDELPFSEGLKRLLWVELRDSGRFKPGLEGIFDCAGVTAPFAGEGFESSDWTVTLSLGRGGELFLAALRALGLQAVAGIEAGHKSLQKAACDD